MSNDQLLLVMPVLFLTVSLTVIAWLAKSFMKIKNWFFSLIAGLVWICGFITLVFLAPITFEYGSTGVIFSSVIFSALLVLRK